MAEMSIDELKAENAAKELEESPPPQADDLEEESAEVEEETDETVEDAETETDDTDDTEIEDWMQPDGHASENADKQAIPNDIAKKIRVKAKEKAERQSKAEIDALKAEIQQLKSQTPANKQDLAKPKYEDFLDHDNPETAYQEALIDYKVNKAQAENDAKLATRDLDQKRQIEQQAIETAVNQHVERAAELISKSNISPELYRSAELKVRERIDELYPEAGDSIVDGLIAKLGKGSEKVFYSLGVKDSRLSELTDRLRRDSTGLEAAIYLGTLKSELSPMKRKSTAPRPANMAQGDKQTGSNARNLKKLYEQAHKSGNMQKAFDVRRQAKEAGVDVKTW